MCNTKELCDLLLSHSQLIATLLDMLTDGLWLGGIVRWKWFLSTKHYLAKWQHD
jgi:hypothetical protein